MKVAPDPVMSEVVRERLEALLAEVRPRHALPPESDPDVQPPPPSAPPRAPTEPDDPVTASPSPPARAAPALEVGARAASLGRQALAFTREHLAAVVVVLLVGCAGRPTARSAPSSDRSPIEHRERRLVGPPPRASSAR